MVMDSAAPSMGAPNVNNVHIPAPEGAIGKPKPRKAKNNQTDDDETEDETTPMREDVINPISLSADGTMPQWIKVFPLGQYEHPRGQLNFDEAFHRRVVQNVNQRVRRIDIALDTDHDNGAANGWLKEARYVPGDGTHLRVDWTKLGEERIRTGAYRYVSPQFGSFTDPKTGKKHDDVLIAVSLTNFPFLKDLPGVGTVSCSELVRLADRATAANPDPDNDGDDDSTEAGDTDHDYTGPNGNRRPRRAKTVEKNKQMGEFALNHPDVPQSDCAGPDHTFPIRNANDVRDAWDLAGHADNPDAVRRRIREIAARKGLSAALPQSAKEKAMSEEITQASVSLAEFQGVMTRLGEQEAEAKRLREELAAYQRRLFEAEVNDEMRSLSEARTIELRADDGTVTTTATTHGIPSVVLSEAREMILARPDNRADIIRLLRRVQEVGTVQLGEIGVARVDNAHDPFALADDQTGDKWVAAAKQYAAAKNLDWTSLSESQKLACFSMTDPKKGHRS